MFTIADIKNAHSKVKSGADFPAYTRELIQLGVESYQTLVCDGHATYYGKEGYTIRSGALYDTQKVAATPDILRFQNDL